MRLCLVNRHILSNTVDAEVTEIDTKLIKCKYILGNQEFETCFSKDTGYRVNSNGKEIEQSYITIKND